MKKRLLFLVKLYIATLLVFVVQKPLFMWLDTPAGHHYGAGDYLSVIRHGLLLDVPVTGYLIALPLLFTLVTCWLPCRVPLRRIARSWYILVAVVAATVFVADASLYPFWNFKLDATIFNYLDSPRNAMASVSTWYVIVRIVAVAVCAAVIYRVFRAVTPARFKPVARVSRRIATTVVLVAVIAPLAVSIRGGLGESTANIGKVYFSEDEYLNHSAVNPCFSLLASLGKSDNYADEFNYFDEGTRRRLFDGLYPATPADTTSLLRTMRPNVIVIIMESYGGQFIEAVSSRKEVAPNYNRLAATEGVFFTNCYSNSFRTDRGTLSTLSGYPAFPTLSVMKLPVKSRTLPCLAASLNAAGYRSSFLYGGDINFTNMQSYLRTGGYGDIVSDVDFPASQRKDNPWGANDNVTFDRLYDMVQAERREPWHIGYLTLSSHEPFVVPYKRLSDPILNAFAFTDDCLGRFVERLKKTPAWRNLLIVCIPDHGFLYPADISHSQHHHNTMLWLGGALRGHRVVNTIMNQSDMAATLLGQLRIDHARYTFSRDIFSPAYRYPFAVFTFREGFGLVDSTGISVYGINDGRLIEDKSAAGHSVLRQASQNARQALQNARQASRQRTDRAKACIQTYYDDLGSR